jgi:hypothetical protein
MLSLMGTKISLIVKVLWKLISGICFRVYIEVNVHKNPTCFSRWSVRPSPYLLNTREPDAKQILDIHVTTNICDEVHHFCSPFVSM